MKRISTLLTFWLVWIMPIAILSFNTLLAIIVIFAEIGIGISIYIVSATILIWLFYLKTKPWTYKHINQNDKGFIFNKKGKEITITYENVLKIYPMFWTKYSPIVIEYSENKKINKITFIPRQSNVLLLLPFFQHPLVEELNNDLKIDIKERKSASRS